MHIDKALWKDERQGYENTPNHNNTDINSKMFSRVCYIVNGARSTFLETSPHQVNDIYQNNSPV